MKNKKKYTPAELEIIFFDNEDVITESQFKADYTQGDDYGSDDDFV